MAIHDTIQDKCNYKGSYYKLEKNIPYLRGIELLDDSTCYQGLVLVGCIFFRQEFYSCREKIFTIFRDLPFFCRYNSDTSVLVVLYKYCMTMDLLLKSFLPYAPRAWGTRYDHGPFTKVTLPLCASCLGDDVLSRFIN